MKNSNDTIRIRTRDLPTCSAVPQPTVPQHAPHMGIVSVKIMYGYAGTQLKRQVVFQVTKRGQKLVGVQKWWCWP